MFINSLQARLKAIINGAKKNQILMLLFVNLLGFNFHVCLHNCTTQLSRTLFDEFPKDSDRIFNLISWQQL